MTPILVENDCKVSLLTPPGFSQVPDGIQALVPGVDWIQREAIDGSEFTSTDVFLVYCGNPDWGWKQIETLRKDERHQHQCVLGPLIDPHQPDQGPDFVEDRIHQTLIFLNCRSGMLLIIHMI